MRSYHFVPAHQKRFLDHIPNLTADAIILELEDGVDGRNKVLARQNMIEYLDELHPQNVYVRINAVDTEYWKEDKEALRCLQRLPRLIIPKVEGPATVDEVLTGMCGSASTVEVIALIESFSALAEIRSITQHPSVVGIGIGLEDMLSKTIHAASEMEGLINFIKSVVAIAAKSAGVLAIDTVSLEVNNMGMYRDECFKSRSYGFDGRFTIHPRQIDEANDIYAPSLDMITWSREMIRISGGDTHGGYRRLEGRVISDPAVKKAINILDHAKHRRSGFFPTDI